MVSMLEPTPSTRWTSASGQGAPLHLALPSELSIILQTVERSITKFPIFGVLFPSPLNLPIRFPPSAGSLKYTFRAVASIWTLSIGTHSLAEQFFALNCVRKYLAMSAHLAEVRSWNGLNPVRYAYSDVPWVPPQYCVMMP